MERKRQLELGDSSDEEPCPKWGTGVSYFLCEALKPKSLLPQDILDAALSYASQDVVGGLVSQGPASRDFYKGIRNGIREITYDCQYMSSVVKDTMQLFPNITSINFTGDTTRTKIDMPPMQRIKSLALPPAALSSMEFDTIMEMHWLIHLDVSGMKLGEIEISKMARNLRNMTCLNVSNTDLTTSGAVMFIRNMPRLEKLYLAGNENVSVDHIEFETLPHLRTLDVRECEIEDRGFELLLGKDTLEELSLMYDELSFEEWMKFMSKLNRFVAVGCTVEGKQGPVEGICYTNLKWLDVSGTKVTSEMMEEIVKFVLLNRLEMNNCELADETICHLGSNLKKLGHLALNENENLIDIDGVVGLEKLEHLGVNNTEIKETGLENIATLTTLTSLDVSTVADLDANMHLLAPLVRLKHLKAFNAYLTPVGAEALAQLQTLNYLDLSAGSTDYQEHEYLSDSYQWNIMPHLSRLTNLHELKMRNSAIGDRGVAYFAQMTNLEELDLNGSTGITDAGQAMLQAHPSLRKFTCAEDTYDEEN